ncbi:MAG: hypothetical protein QOI10_430 [Solirubrobacterales bacterium]|jgi:hypothetical protein|nr:hypothetical protein [Solirubrobacterales bacterium]
MRKLIAAVALVACLALAGSASARSRHYGEPTYCGTGEPAYTGWNYTDLWAYGLACRVAHATAEEYVYDFSTEGVIEPPAHWKWCKDKPVGGGMFKGRCARVKDGRPQKITFLFSGPDQPWFH